MSTKQEELFYIQNKGYCGNCLIWWRIGGHGYTCNLDEAWMVTREKAESICSDRPKQDIMWLAEIINGISVRHVTCECAYIRATHI
jgi:hypothetical protein